MLDNHDESLERQCPLCNQAFRVLLHRIVPEDSLSDGKQYMTEGGTCTCGYEHRKEIEKK